MSLGAALRRLARTSGKLDTSRAYITMFDDISVSVLPSGGSYAYAGYTGGLWPTFKELLAKYPGRRLLSIAVFASDDADCLDIENRDASLSDAPGWYERQVHRGVWRPCLYTSASNLRALEQMMASHHVQRSEYRLWSAHYTGKAHICGPKSCGFGLSEADGTQWTSTALGISLDQSILLPNFFDQRPGPNKPPVPAIPTWQENMMYRLPTLQQGDQDGPGKIETVGRMQALMKYIGAVNNIESAKSLTVDGDFGVHTTNALLAVQEFFGLHDTDEYRQRVCGPRTWPALVTGQP